MTLAAALAVCCENPEELVAVPEEVESSLSSLLSLSLLSLLSLLPEDLESVLDESELVCVAVLPVPVEVVEEWVAVAPLPLLPQKSEL